MRERDFKKLTYWIDYDKPLLSELTKNQKVVYFEKRLKMVVLIPVHELHVSFIKRKKHSSTLLCFATCICCAIGTLGRFLSGTIYQDNSDINFLAFIKAYMSFEYGELLWENFRNGLIYGFTIKQGGFQNGSNYFNVKSTDEINNLEIDPTHFYQDFVDGTSKYILDLKKADINDEIYLKFNNVFDAIFINGL